MRHYIRHPVDIPIAVRYPDHAQAAPIEVLNVSRGGLAFQSENSVEPGAVIEIRIEFVRPPFESKARVAWCRDRNGKYLVGVAFFDADDAFRARMVEQVCYIENYRNMVSSIEGRKLSVEQAAFEWIERYAEQFPNPDASNMH